MANLVKAVLSFDDGSTQEFDAAPVVVPTTPDVQGVSLEDLQKAEADAAAAEAAAATVVADTTAEVNNDTPVPVVEAPAEPTA